MMRSLRALVRFVLGITLGATGAAILAGPSLNAQAIGGLNTLTVSPSHGQASSSFTVTYTISPCQAAAGLTIGFSWGGAGDGRPGVGNGLDGRELPGESDVPAAGECGQPPAARAWELSSFWLCRAAHRWRHAGN